MTSNSVALTYFVFCICSCTESCLIQHKKLQKVATYHANYIVKGFLKGDIQSKIILAFKWHVLKCISIRKKKKNKKQSLKVLLLDYLFFFFKPNSFGITVPVNKYRNNINSMQSLLCSYSFLKKTN